MKSQLKSALKKAYRFKFMETAMSNYNSKKAGKPVEQRERERESNSRGYLKEGEDKLQFTSYVDTTTGAY